MKFARALLCACSIAAAPPSWADEPPALPDAAKVELYVPIGQPQRQESP